MRSRSRRPVHCPVGLVKFWGEMCCCEMGIKLRKLGIWVMNESGQSMAGWLGVIFN